MRKIIVILSILFIVSCGSNKPSYDIANVSLVSDEKGEVVLETSAENSKDGIPKAQRLAIETLLFRGIPNSAYYLPLVSNRNEALTSHSKYFNHLFEQGYYKTFIVSSSNFESYKDGKKNKKNKITKLNIRVNYNALRRDLEQNGVIRKFGY